MTGTEIIAKFGLQVDDTSSLSTAESLALANDIYSEICNDRDWEWLKTSASGTTSVSVPYIALPADFKYIAPNKEGKSVVFVGTNHDEYEVISFADRRNYRNMDGYCYIDVPNSRLVFTLQPTSAKAVEYDYIKVETAIQAGTSPLFRAGFHKIIAFGMAARFSNIEQTDKGNSYQKENKELYDSVLEEMAIEDAKIKLSI